MTAWQYDFTQQLSMLPMQQLEQLFSLSSLSNWPNASGLNALKSKLLSPSHEIPEFVCQSQITDSTLYYEQIIQQKNIIPTRPNSWHDLFNGLIWLQFPQTKRLLNLQHVEDIHEHGLSPRTLRRNNLTHFDECGVIVTYQKASQFEQVIQDLQQHQWHSVFVENRKYWGHQLNAFVFGHANLEMLLQPFLGLTGKWLAVEVDSQFTALSYSEQLMQLDEQLAANITQTQLFAEKKPLYPMPLLGIPNIWEANIAPEFYQNTNYFRPKRASIPVPKVK